METFIPVQGKIHIIGANVISIPYSALGYKPVDENCQISLTSQKTYPLLKQYENLLITSKFSVRYWDSLKRSDISKISQYPKKFFSFTISDSVIGDNIELEMYDLIASLFEQRKHFDEIRDCFTRENLYGETKIKPIFFHDYVDRFLLSLNKVWAIDHNFNTVFVGDDLKEALKTSYNHSYKTLLYELNDGFVGHLKNSYDENLYTIKLIDIVLNWYENIKQDVVELLDSSFNPIKYNADNAIFKFGEWNYLQDFQEQFKNETLLLNLQYKLTFEQILQMYCYSNREIKEFLLDVSKPIEKDLWNHRQFTVFNKLLNVLHTKFLHLIV